MKSSFLAVLVVMILAPVVAFPQSTAREIEKDFYKADPQISIVINYLPKGWTFTSSGDKFLVTAKDSAWVLEEETGSAPAESKNARNERIRSQGVKILPQLVLRYEEKWTAERLQRAKITNANIDDEIKKLPAKYHIQSMVDSVKSSKSGIVYKASNDKERKLLSQYETELSQLLSRKIKLPDFHTEKYSLFVEQLTGVIDEKHLVFPEDASLSAYTVLSTFREVCGK